MSGGSWLAHRPMMFLRGLHVKHTTHTCLPVTLLEEEDGGIIAYMYTTQYNKKLNPCEGRHNHFPTADNALGLRVMKTVHMLVDTH